MAAAEEKNTQKRKEPEHEQDNGNDAENQPEEKEQKADQGEATEDQGSNTPDEDSLVECASLATSQTKVLYNFI